MLVPHISSTANVHEPSMAMIHASDAMPHDGHTGTAHDTWGGIACAVVCFGAPVVDDPALPMRILHASMAPYAVFWAESHSAPAPDPAMRSPDPLRSV